MTAIRHTLQRELFQPVDERLISFIHVAKTSNKRQEYFLCITVTTEPPVVVRIHQVKKSTDFFKRKKCWFLKELHLVDGKNPRKLVPEMELTFEKLYRWLASNPNEKEPFIRQLWKLSERYLPAQKPDFVNISIPVEELELALSQNATTAYSAAGSSAADSGIGQACDEFEDYQPISNREENDFRKLLASCQLTLADCERFYDHLTKKLSTLDSANMQAIMGRESEVLQLMKMIDRGLEDLSALEHHLDKYDALLAHVSERIEMMEEKDSIGRIQTANRVRLQDDLAALLNLLDVSLEQQTILRECNFYDPVNINRCAQAAQSVQKVIKAKVPAGLETMRACVEQRRECVQLANGFAEKLTAHLSALFDRFSQNDKSEFASTQSNPGTLPKHSALHQILMPYAELVLWLKGFCVEAYRMLIDKYVSAFKSLYEIEISDFFAVIARDISLPSLPMDRKASVKRTSAVDRNDINRLSKSPAVEKVEGNQLVLPELDANEQQRFEKLVESLLQQIEPVLLSEQKFCIRFFHLSTDMLNLAETMSTGSGDSGGSPEKRLEKQFNDEVRKMMMVLFNRLDSELQGFVTICDRSNPFFTVFLLSHMWSHVMSAHDSATYVSIILGKAVVLVKRKFDAFMENLCSSLRTVRISKRVLVGILPFVANFETLVRQTESAFRDCTRRNDIERWYVALLEAICAAVDRLSNDANSKSPPAVVRMENYHRIYDVLSRLKVGCLEKQRIAARQKYQDSLQSYVVEHMGRPLDKLASFFDAIQARVEQGLKPDEIGYQIEFSKQELRRLIALYPGKEVKRGLETLYAKVEKQVSEEENLLQVVWHKMQDEFIRQHQLYGGLMAQCYPGASLCLEFSIDELLHFFSEIAQQH